MRTLCFLCILYHSYNPSLWNLNPHSLVRLKTKAKFCALRRCAFTHGRDFTYDFFDFCRINNENVSNGSFGTRMHEKWYLIGLKRHTSLLSLLAFCSTDQICKRYKKRNWNFCFSSNVPCSFCFGLGWNVYMNEKIRKTIKAM